jgi:hypothetical protein
LYFRAPPNSCLGDEIARFPEVFRAYTLRAKFLIAMISVKSGPMPGGPAGAERGGGRRGWSWRPFGSNVSNGVPGSFDRMF